ncbi:MAG TPA: hypothetical protein VFH94_10945 [Streptomyces sp.]|nr:hypothetical protein [Streptomyces sp.]
MSRDRAAEHLDMLLASAHEQLGVAVYDGLMGRGGPPELRDPDQVLGRLLAAAHRGVGEAVVGRLTRHGRERAQDAGAKGTARGTNLLMQRSAAVRLKYRARALGIARRYWPQDLAQVTSEPVEAVQDLVAALEGDALTPAAQERLRRVSSALGKVLLLPESVQQRPVPVGGYDYVEAVKDHVATCTVRLVASARRAKELLDNELVPHMSASDDSWLGLLEVSEYLADYLDLTHREAVSLARAVAEVEEASTDFRGADLRAVDLDGVQLAGIRWDAATEWPADWRERIWNASLAADTGDGELVVGAEPHDSTVSADI